ncbi:MAG: hypothetical protein H7A39_07415 [Chlamydiales bacterium]|nr:hypothetical protein [Chlamydiales bacterium]
MSTNNVQAKKPSINQQITDAQNARNKYLAVAMCALVGSALAAGGAGYLGLVASGMMGASVVVLIGPQAVIGAAALAAVVALVLVAVAGCCVLGAIVNQNKAAEAAAADTTLELFPNLYKMKPAAAAMKTGNLNNQIAVDVKRRMTIYCDGELIFHAMPGETVENIEVRVQSELREKFSYDLLDQCHQASMDCGTKFIIQATGRLFSNTTGVSAPLSPKIDKEKQIVRDSIVLFEKGPDEDLRGLKCEMSVMADIKKDLKITHLDIKENDVSICEVDMKNHLNGKFRSADINMKTTADRLTKLWAQATAQWSARPSADEKAAAQG